METNTNSINRCGFYSPHESHERVAPFRYELCLEIDFFSFKSPAFFQAPRCLASICHPKMAAANEQAVISNASVYNGMEHARKWLILVEQANQSMAIINHFHPKWMPPITFGVKPNQCGQMAPHPGIPFGSNHDTPNGSN